MKEIDTWEAVKTIFKLSAFPSVGALFNPAHSIMNTMYLGHSDTPEELSGYGLGNMIVVMVLAIGGITA
jgi:Na+-driven multidrug efflux pump